MKIKERAQIQCTQETILSLNSLLLKTCIYVFETYDREKKDKTETGNR